MGLLIVIILVVALAAVTLVTVTLVRVRSGRRGISDTHGLLWQFAGLLAGCLLCAVVALVDSPRQPLILALPSLAGCCWLLSLIAAELTRRRRHSGTVRVAGLALRTPGCYLVRWALVGMRLAFAGTAALALTASLLASPRDSTQISALRPAGQMLSHGPWPGWYYSLPALVGLLVGWLLTELAIRTVVGRAPILANADADERARAQAARAALAAASLMAVPVLGVLLVTMGSGLVSISPSALLRGMAWGMQLVGGILVLASAAAWLSALASGGRAVIPLVGQQ
jgi:hypothetical protein